MLGKDLSEALGGIADDKIEAAANLAPVQRRPIWVRVAACAAVLALLIGSILFWPDQTDGQIVEAPGILKVYGCAVDETADFVQMEDYLLSREPGYVTTNVWSPECSLVTGVPVTLWVSQEGLEEHRIAFELTANYGELYDRNYECRDFFSDPNAATINGDAFLGKTATLENKSTFYWEGYELLDMCNDRTIGEVMDEIGAIYVDVVIRADENIVGYAVFEMVSLNNDAAAFAVQLRGNAFYPKINGQFQNVAEEYVRQQIEGAKQKDPNTVEGGVYCSARAMSEACWLMTSSGALCLRYTCRVTDADYADAEITFELSTNNGVFWTEKGRLSEHITVDNGVSVRWKGDWYIEETVAEDGAVYVDVIIRADGNVIGYAVIKIARTAPELESYCTKYCKSVCLPMVDGEYPDLTEEDARQEIEKIKAE